MPLSVVVLLKRTSYNKETKREAENERRENERNQSRGKMAITVDSTPDPKFFVKNASQISSHSGFLVSGLEVTYLYLVF